MRILIPYCLVFIGFLCGCASGPDTYTIQVKGEPSLNLNSKGDSTPVNMRIYQLRDRGSFEAADFDSLWEDGEVLLVDDVVEVTEHVVTTTQEMIPIVLLGADDVRFIGIVGLFNQQGESWRVCIPVEEVEDWLFSFDGFEIQKLSS